jgi:hypothetical protein
MCLTQITNFSCRSTNSVLGQDFLANHIAADGTLLLQIRFIHRKGSAVMGLVSSEPDY